MSQVVAAGAPRSEKDISLYDIALAVAWANKHAQEPPLKESHRLWTRYFTYSEWFRHRICTRLDLPLSTEWPEIYRRVGVLAEERYLSHEAWQEAYDFGTTHFLEDTMVPVMFEEFEVVRFLITGRL